MGKARHSSFVRWDLIGPRPIQHALIFRGPPPTTSPKSQRRRFGAGELPLDFRTTERALNTLIQAKQEIVKPIFFSSLIIHSFFKVLKDSLVLFTVSLL
ncbi:hypothetical protein Pfo_003111 [Paulownia fortunei]|nr:hypothetical protein Pfo_003111 [Paulownia fortunei]